MNIDTRLILDNIAYIVPLIIALFLILSSAIEFNKRRIKNRGFLTKLRKISETKVMKKFLYSEDSQDYRSIELKLKKAGLGDMSVGTYQIIKYLVPLVMYIFIVAIKYTNITASIMNQEKLQKVAEFTGKASLSEIKTDLNLPILFVVSLAFYFIPNIVLKVLTAFRNQRGSNEVMTLHTYTVMMLKAKRSVKQILVSLWNRSSIYKQHLEKAVNSYSKDPQGAIRELQENVGHPQFEKVCIGLEQALDNDPKLSIKYLENHRELGKELNKINRQKKSVQKNMIGLVLLIMPMLGFVLVGGYPWMVYALKQLDAVPM